MGNEMEIDHILILKEEIADLSSIIHDQEEYITDLESQVIMLEKQLDDLANGNVQ